MTDKVTLTGAQETTLATLYGKAMESRRPDSILRDTAAFDVLARVDYDFGKLRVRRSDHTSLAMRARAYDIWAGQFIATHRNCTVLHLGCGLDTRAQRVAPPASVSWYDVDFPDVIALRHNLFGSDVPTIAKSITDPTLLDGIAGDGPVLVVAEGVTPYLPAAEGIAMLRRITGHFPSGELLFDGYGRWGLWFLQRYGCVKASGARLGWNIDDPRDLERAVPGLRFDTELWYSDAPGMDRHLSTFTRRLLHVVYRIRAVRRLGRPLRYTFG